MTSFELDRSQLLSVNELVKRWENSLYPVSAVTLARWRRDGRGPEYIKIGAAGRIYYSLGSVQEFEVQNNIGTPLTSTNA